MNAPGSHKVKQVIAVNMMNAQSVIDSAEMVFDDLPVRMTSDQCGRQTPRDRFPILPSVGETVEWRYFRLGFVHFLSPQLRWTHGWSDMQFNSDTRLVMGSVLDCRFGNSNRSDVDHPDGMMVKIPDPSLALPRLCGAPHGRGKPTRDIVQSIVQRPERLEVLLVADCMKIDVRGRQFSEQVR